MVAVVAMAVAVAVILLAVFVRRVILSVSKSWR